MKQTTLFRYIQAWLFGCCLCLAPVAAHAVHDGFFQLEGNAVDDAAATEPDDWETLYDDLNNGTNNGNDDVFTFVSENADVSIFGGGNKDIHDVSEWNWVDGSVPDKSNILDAFAAAYNDNGDLTIYFGADRFANAGDTFLGFWFFVEEVGIIDDPQDPNFGDFYGNHTSATFSNGKYSNGDVLVLVNFPQANNAVPLIQVLVWDETCPKAASNNPGPLDCAARNLRLIEGQSGAGAICGGPGADLACAVSNDENGPHDPTPSPWPYTSKDGFVNQFPYETFFEGGINITELVGGDGCFASFMAETRSSSSFTAQLKDFITGAFPLCGFEIDKSCEADLNASDTEVTVNFSGNVYNTGVASLSIDLTDTAPGGVALFNAFCIDTGGDGCDGGDTAITNTGTQGEPTIVVPGNTTVRYEGSYTVANPNLADLNFTDTVTAEAYSTTGAGALIDTKDAVANCFAANPTIDVTKNCTAALINNDTYQATLSGTIQNTGNVLLSNVDLSDVATDGSGITPNNFVAWYESVAVNGVQDAGEASFTLGSSSMQINDLVAYTGSLTKTDDTNHSDEITASAEYLVNNVVDESVSDTASVISCGLAPLRSLSIVKECGTQADPDGVALVAHSGALAVEITNMITVTNTGDTSDHEDLNVLLTDTLAETVQKVSGPATVSCTSSGCNGRLDVGETLVVKTTYLPDASLGPIIEQGTATFTNTATAAYSGVLTQGDPEEMSDSATCELCN